MPKYTYSMTMAQTYYTTVTAPNEREAERLASENFFNFEDLESGDSEWEDSLMLEDEEEND